MPHVSEIVLYGLTIHTDIYLCLFKSESGSNCPVALQLEGVVSYYLKFQYNYLLFFQIPVNFHFDYNNSFLFVCIVVVFWEAGQYWNLKHEIWWVFHLILFTVRFIYCTSNRVSLDLYQLFDYEACTVY